jgi:hypothetical protein
MPHKTTLLLLSIVTLAACQAKDAEPVEEVPVTLPEVFPNLPLPPGGQVVSRTGTGSAMQMVFSTPVAGDTVAAYYRDILAKPPYQLINESTNDGVVAFFVEQDGPSMWVAVQGLEAGGTLVTIAGARPRVAPTDTTRTIDTRPINPDELPRP